MTLPQSEQPRLPTWWELDPQRLEQELQALRADGYQLRVHAGQSRLRVHLHRRGEPPPWHHLTVTFPATYPWSDARVALSPRVLRRQGVVLRHVDPGSGRVCLVGETPEADHDPTELVATVLARQLPRVRAANDPGADLRALADVEEHAPINHQAWLEIRAADTLVLDPTYDPAGPHGWVRLKPGSLSGWLDAIVACGLTDQDGAVHDWFPCGPAERESDRLPWVRLDRELDPLTDTATRLWQEGRRLLPAGTLRRDLPQQHLLLRVPDEIGYRETGWDWLYLTRTRVPDGQGRGWQSPRRGLVQHAGAAVQAVRAPRAAHLHDKAVLVVGLGALGSVVATHLVRAGLGGIALLDPKLVDAASTVRQYSVSAGGLPKAGLLATQLRGLKPDLTLLKASIFDVLDYAPGHLRDLIQQVDLVIDATADRAASRYLGVQTQRHRRPYVSFAATAGGFGGWIVVLQPDGPCQCCLEHARADGLLPQPPADPDGLIHPQRCVHGTFTGTGYDLAPLGALAARTVTDHLRGDGPQSAVVYTYDSGLRDQALPTWTSTPLQPHPACVSHGRPLPVPQEPG